MRKDKRCRKEKKEKLQRAKWKFKHCTERRIDKGKKKVKEP